MFPNCDFYKQLHCTMFYKEGQGLDSVMGDGIQFGRRYPPFGTFCSPWSLIRTVEGLLLRVQIGVLEIGCSVYWHTVLFKKKFFFCGDLAVVMCPVLLCIPCSLFSGGNAAVFIPHRCDRLMANECLVPWEQTLQMTWKMFLKCPKCLKNVLKSQMAFCSYVIKSLDFLW